ESGRTEIRPLSVALALHRRSYGSARLSALDSRLLLQPLLSTLRSRLSAALLAHPHSRVAEQPDPRTVVVPLRRVPGEVDAAEHALRVGHDRGEATVRRGDGGDAAGRTVRVERI